MSSNNYLYLATIYGARKFKRILKTYLPEKIFNKLDTRHSLKPYWSIQVTLKCNADCSYCIQGYSFNDGRKGIPEFNGLKPEEWLKIIEIKNKPDEIVIQGGEPLLYKGLNILLKGLHSFKKITVVSNLALDITQIAQDIKSINTHKVEIVSSFHPCVVDFDTFISRVLLLRDIGSLESVKMVDIDMKQSLQYTKRFAEHNIDLIIQPYIGDKEGEVYTHKRLEPSNYIRKPPVSCKTNLVLFAPNGDIYNCHTKMYWGDKGSSFGNLSGDYEIPEGSYVCHDYGYCNPCQVYFMEVSPVDFATNGTSNSKVLLSNPPDGLIKP